MRRLKVCDRDMNPRSHGDSVPAGTGIVWYNMCKSNPAGVACRCGLRSRPAVCAFAQTVLSMLHHKLRCGNAASAAAGGRKSNDKVV